MARKFIDMMREEHCVAMLQWDRASDGAEMLFDGPSLELCYLLQWDRTSDGAEMLLAESTSSSLTIRFNGTAPVMARKSNPARGKVGLREASMGPHQ